MRLDHLRRPLALLLAVGFVLVLPWVPPFDTSFEVSRLGAAAAIAIIVVGLNLLTGASGQISLGHSGLALIGAYIAAILMTKGVAGTEVPPLAAVVIAALGTGVLGFGLGLPALRLSGLYLAIATLVLAIAAPIIFRHPDLADVTGGTLGLSMSSPRPPDALDFLSVDKWRFYIISVPAVLLCFFAWNLNRIRFGRALRAIRDSELGAQQMGINVPLYKTLAFAISSGYAGLGGALLTYVNVGFVGPDSFTLTNSIGYLTAIVVGGVGSVIGSILGALFLAYQTEIVGWVANDTWNFDIAGEHLFSLPSPVAYALGITLEGKLEPVSNPSDLRWFVYGLILIIVVSVMPSGAAGFAASAWRIGRSACRDAWNRLAAALRQGASRS